MVSKTRQIADQHLVFKDQGIDGHFNEVNVLWSLRVSFLFQTSLSSLTLSLSHSLSHHPDKTFTDITLVENIP